jgi:acyl-CoA synthetase (AMP-forming)/AMP-acid ligase II
VNNIAEMLRIRALATPDKIGVRYLEHESSWQDLYHQAYRLSQNLQRASIGKGDVVGIYIPHSLGQVVALFAVAMRDAVFTIINPHLVPDQVKHQVQDASAKAVIGTADLLSPMEDFFSNRQMHVEMLDPAGFSGGDASSEVDLNEKLTTNIPADVSNYIYTSGSTGLAKGVVVPQRTLLDGARIVSQYLGISQDDNILSILPFSFDYGLNQLMSCVYTGAKIVLHQFIFAKDLIDILIGEQITGMAVVPSVWPKLLKPGLKKDNEFGHLRYVTTAGGFHPPALLQSVSEFFPGTEIIVMYGLTESFRSTYLPFSEMKNRPGSIGKAVPEVELLVLNGSGECCKPGEKGELVHRGAFVTYGYLNNPELNEKKFVRLNMATKTCLPEVAVRSGDQVSIDEDGYIYFHGRMDMQIKSSGYRISPDEVAQAVLSTPGIAQAVVFGLSDDTLGEAIHVAYETYDGKEIKTIEIKRHAKASLAQYAIPHHYHFYEKIKLNANGKVDFSSLKRDASAGNDQPQGSAAQGLSNE